MPVKRRIYAGPGDGKWVQQQQLISLRHSEHGTAEGKSSALSVLLGFSEYTLTYFELLVMRAVSSVSEAAKLQQSCVHKPLGYAVAFSFNNVYHSIFHAVPAAEHLAELQYSSSNDAVSLEAVDQTATFVPILHHRMAYRGPSDAKRWYAWQFAVRALTSRSAESIIQETESVLSGCTCFERLEGAAKAFNFNARESRERMRTFRHALLLHVGRTSTGTPLSLISLSTPQPTHKNLLYIGARLYAPLRTKPNYTRP